MRKMLYFCVSSRNCWDWVLFFGPGRVAIVPHQKEGNARMNEAGHRISGPANLFGPDCQQMPEYRTQIKPTSPLRNNVAQITTQTRSFQFDRGEPIPLLATEPEHQCDIRLRSAMCLYSGHTVPNGSARKGPYFVSIN